MRRAIRWLAVGSGAAALAAGCGNSSKATTPTSLPAKAGLSKASSAPPQRGSGPVNVLYAGSLVSMMQYQVGPGFQAATGYSLNGFSAGSTALAAQIKGKVRRADVFISASRSVNATLEGPANGSWVSWYVTFATSPLVLGYNPSSKFAEALRTEPWYQAISQPRILVGRTDPATDPKGKLTVEALDAAAADYDEPALRGLTTSTSGVYPEETLVGRLQAGQLDAGFFYSSEAVAASIPFAPVTIPAQKLEASYTVTILAGAPDRAGAQAFVDYLLGPQGQAILEKDGFHLVQPPAISGSGVPPGVHSAVSGS